MKSGNPPGKTTAGFRHPGVISSDQRVEQQDLNGLLTDIGAAPWREGLTAERVDGQQNHAAAGITVPDEACWSSRGDGFTLGELSITRAPQ